ncbi:hypothetical protein B0H11DRAFT_2017838, partial [Mycena galericulata]
MAVTLLGPDAEVAVVAVGAVVVAGTFTVLATAGAVTLAAFVAVVGAVGVIAFALAVVLALAFATYAIKVFPFSRIEESNEPATRDSNPCRYV